MKKLLIFVLTIILSILLALYIKEDQGYLLLSYKQWIIEMSIWTGILILLMSFFIIHKGLNVITFFSKIPVKSRYYLYKRRQHKMYAKTSMGLLKLAEGNFKQAYSLLSQSAVSQKKPLINYLTAAKAAQEIGEINKRDECLRKAFECSPKSGLSIGIMQANLQCCNHEYEAALATLNHLQHKYGVNKLVLKQLLDVYVNLKDWYKLIKLVPELKRYKIIPDEEILTVEVMAAVNYFKEYANSRNNLTNVNQNVVDEQQESELEFLYNKELSKQTKYNYKVVIAYINSLIIEPSKDYLNYHGDLKLTLTNKALSIIEKALQTKETNSSKKAQQKLIELLGEIAYSESHFKLIEKLLKNNSYNIDLLFVLGRLAISLELYDKAYQYLNQASRLASKSNVGTDLPIDNYLSFVLLKLGREQDGLELFTKSIAG